MCGLLKLLSATSLQIHKRVLVYNVRVDRSAVSLQICNQGSIEYRTTSWPMDNKTNSKILVVKLLQLTTMMSITCWQAYLLAVLLELTTMMSITCWQAYLLAVLIVFVAYAVVRCLSVCLFIRPSRLCIKTSKHSQNSHKNRDFRPISRFILEMIQDRASYCGTEIETRTRSIEQCYFQWSWVTLQFKVTTLFNVK